MVKLIDKTTLSNSLLIKLSTTMHGFTTSYHLPVKPTRKLYLKHPWNTIYEYRRGVIPIIQDKKALPFLQEKYFFLQENILPSIFIGL